MTKSTLLQEVFGVSIDRGPLVFELRSPRLRYATEVGTSRAQLLSSLCFSALVGAPLPTILPFFVLPTKLFSSLSLAKFHVTYMC